MQIPKFPWLLDKYQSNTSNQQLLACKYCKRDNFRSHSGLQMAASLVAHRGRLALQPTQLQLQQFLHCHSSSFSQLDHSSSFSQLDRLDNVQNDGCFEQNSASLLHRRSSGCLGLSSRAPLLLRTNCMKLSMSTPKNGQKCRQ